MVSNLPNPLDHAHMSAASPQKRHHPADSRPSGPNRTPPSTKGCRYPVELLTTKEIERLLGQFSRRSPSGMRNQALVVTLWRAGLRLQEALDLRPRDLDLDAGTINVQRGKGGKQRIVAMDPTAMAVVAQWMARRAKLGAGRAAPLFCQISTGAVGKPMSPSYVRTALKRAADRAGIDKRVHPHQLRHVMATSLAREQFPLRLVQQQLGHSSLATTERYLAKLAPEELAAAMGRRQW
jgi:site-specific recombinase XerD